MYFRQTQAPVRFPAIPRGRLIYVRVRGARLDQLASYIENPGLRIIDVVTPADFRTALTEVIDAIERP